MTAAQIHRKLFNIYDTLFMLPNPVPVKSALKIAWKDVGGLRGPLKHAPVEVEKRLERCLRELDLLDDYKD